YWIDGHMTANAYMAKARLAWSKLARRGDDSAAIVVYTHAAEDAEADRRLADFVGAIAPQLRSQLERTRRSAR
ncbi:MAG: EpsI family protein, partial [Burkholderiales bacterium]|nr:EpsI family protein [Burkholderiales bacterium]